MSSIYDGPIIDPHHHLWDLSMGCHPWLQQPVSDEMVFGSIAAIQRDYGLAEYLADARGHNIVSTIHVEAGWRDGDPRGEIDWLDTLPKADGVASRYVARMALDAPEALQTLEALAAHPLVVGIRDIVSWHPDPAKSFARRPSLMSDPAWRAGLARLAPLGLRFDLMLYPWQMEEAATLVAAFPETMFVLNHCGSPADRSADGMALWRKGLLHLGRFDNASCKISDLVAYDNHWTLDSLREIILHCIDAFGPARAMFASDFPVAGLHATFDEIYDAFRKIAGAFSQAEQRDLFFGSANRIYDLRLGGHGNPQG